MNYRSHSAFNNKKVQDKLDELYFNDYSYELQLMQNVLPLLCATYEHLCVIKYKICYNIFNSMTEQQSFSSLQIQALLLEFLKGPSLACISNSVFRNLVSSLEWQKIQILLLDAVSQIINQQDQVVIRIKCCILLHLLISSNINHKTAALIQQILIDHEAKLRKDTTKQKIEDADDYFEINVELPYVGFLKKLLLWQVMNLGRIQAGFISIGFSQINKIKEILQLKKIFHNYSCYYPSHKYALNLFQACLHNIKTLWVSVCIKVQEITVDSLKVNFVDEKHFLFVEEAQKLQDLLIQFVYAQKFCAQLPKDLRIKQINLVKPELGNLSAKRQRKRSMEIKLQFIEEKVKKASIKTMETDRIHSMLASSNQAFKENSSLENKLDTGKQTIILHTINEMQDLINL